MKVLAAIIAGGMFVVPALWPQESPRIDGYVTRVVSNSEFDVDEVRVLCGAETQSFSFIKPGTSVDDSGCPSTLPYVGEPAQIYGSLKKKRATITATRINLTPVLPGPVKGSAVIDALPRRSASAESGTLLVRADGYPILIDSKTAVKWVSPLHALADVRPGNWIEYRGELSANGGVHADEAKIIAAVVPKGAIRAREKADREMAALPQPAQQNGAGAKFVVVNKKVIPPCSDPSLQTRVYTIAEKLIPSFQRDLPDSDPLKIKFRFQVTDDKRWHEITAFPSGIVLIPHKAVDRLQNDSQLAAVLAESIAFIMENEAYRMRITLTDAAVASFGVISPLIALDPILELSLGPGPGTDAERKREEQTGRIALDLMHDAGYDVDQAPVAWWLLAAKEQKPLSDIEMPYRAAYLYRILGELWHNPAAARDQSPGSNLAMK
jgi:hypothetical protein